MVLDDVSLTHVTFSPAFAESVEAKQIAQQTAQKAAYLVDQAIQEKQSIIVRAQGEAKSAELIGDAIKKSKGFVQLRRLEAAREIANVVAGGGNRVMLDSDTLLMNCGSRSSWRILRFRSDAVRVSKWAILTLRPTRSSNCQKPQIVCNVPRSTILNGSERRFGSNFTLFYLTLLSLSRLGRFDRLRI